LVALAMLASLKRELGDLDRVAAWLRVFGMVNAAPDFTMPPAVINGCSDLLLDVYGPDAGQPARSAVGLATLPFNIPVEIAAEVEIASKFAAWTEPGSATPPSLIGPHPSRPKALTANC